MFCFHAPNLRRLLSSAGQLIVVAANYFWQNCKFTNNRMYNSEHVHPFLHYKNF